MIRSLARCVKQVPDGCEREPRRPIPCTGTSLRRRADTRLVQDQVAVFALQPVGVRGAHDTDHAGPRVDGRRATCPSARAQGGRQVRRPPLPDATRQCRPGRASGHRGGRRSVRPGRPQRHPGVPRRRPRVPDPEAPGGQGTGPRLGPEARRRAQGSTPPPPPGVRPAHPPVGARPGGRGVPPQRVDAPAALARGEAGCPRPARDRVEAGRARDHQPGPRRRQGKKLRDRRIAEAAECRPAGLAPHEARVRELARDDPDATLAELRPRLGVEVGTGALCNYLRRLKLSFKKARPAIVTG